jgi:hypothetical protein
VRRRPPRPPRPADPDPFDIGLEIVTDQLAEDPTDPRHHYLATLR